MPIKENLVPPELSASQTNLIYATEADVLNMALFGMTARDLREKNPGRKGNVRDDADVSQLVCLSNLDKLNPRRSIRENIPLADRLRRVESNCYSANETVDRQPDNQAAWGKGQAGQVVALHLKFNADKKKAAPRQDKAATTSRPSLRSVPGPHSKL